VLGPKQAKILANSSSSSSISTGLRTGLDLFVFLPLSLFFLRTLSTSTTTTTTTTHQTNLAMSSTDPASGPGGPGGPGNATGPGGPGGPGGNFTGPPPPFDPSLLTEVPITEKMAHLSRIYVGVTSVLLVLCTLAFLTRMYQRIRPVWKVGWDDCFIVVGFVSLSFPFLFFFFIFFYKKKRAFKLIPHSVSVSSTGPFCSCNNGQKPA